MTLRVKLVISFTVLLLVVIVTVGFVASRSIRSILVAQTDQTLTTFNDRDPRPRPSPPQDSVVDEGPSALDREPFLRPVAQLYVDPDGAIVYAEPSGFSDDPDPLPDVSSITESGLTYLDSVDGSLEYRALVQPLAEGYIVVRAAPLTEVATATDELVRTLIIAGLGVLLVGGSVTWWMVRRSMKPVDEMVDTAEAIAHGDLGRRIPEADPNTELGRLGGSLNEMLTAIEHSLDSEREGRERLRQFVADASHELRTPLTTIAGYAELQRTGGLADRGAEDRAWSRVDSEGKRMKRLVEDLLTLARLGQTVPLDISDVDVAAVCRDAASDHAVADPTRPIEVTGDAPVEIRGDSGRLHQVIASLLNNVTVHTPEGTEVTIAVSDTGSGCRVSVSDDGPGIPGDAVGHVFDRFYRVDPSRSRRSGGAGLGLAIVHAIVTAHGGTVEASNNGDGGASFVIDLPPEPPSDEIHRAGEAGSQPLLRAGR